MKDDFVSRFEGILGAIQEVRGDLKAMAGRRSEAEDNNEEGVATLKSYTTTLKAAMEELALKVDDLENRARRSNLRLVGLPESTEGLDVCAFLEKWIPKTLCGYNFPGPLLIERAH
ncbi:hypothetical protein JOB18_039435 [Solea senegalensis]|uniref:Uncharacterized protein n=1 Tax=Solea senegalensis TaxID=28829 RepID=A0AAV6TAB5_SOLSE|nr:hypothetical protein JOB18_039435 [Solea senegalensis]